MQLEESVSGERRRRGRLKTDVQIEIMNVKEKLVYSPTQTQEIISVQRANDSSCPKPPAYEQFGSHMQSQGTRRIAPPFPRGRGYGERPICAMRVRDGRAGLSRHCLEAARPRPSESRDFCF